MQRCLFLALVAFLELDHLSQAIGEATDQLHDLVGITFLALALLQAIGCFGDVPHHLLDSLGIDLLRIDIVLALAGYLAGDAAEQPTVFKQCGVGLDQPRQLLGHLAILGHAVLRLALALVDIGGHALAHLHRRLPLPADVRLEGADELVLVSLDEDPGLGLFALDDLQLLLNPVVDILGLALAEIDHVGGFAHHFSAAAAFDESLPLVRMVKFVGLGLRIPGLDQFAIGLAAALAEFRRPEVHLGLQRIDGFLSLRDIGGVDRGIGGRGQVLQLLQSLLAATGGFDESLPVVLHLELEPRDLGGNLLRFDLVRLGRQVGLDAEQLTEPQSPFAYRVSWHVSDP